MVDYTCFDGLGGFDGAPDDGSPYCDRWSDYLLVG